jgi:beta-lactamase regulating signal transducer with metallopeptidase domain
MIALIDRLLAASIETVAAASIVFLIGAVAVRRAPRLVALLWLVVLVKPLLTLAGVSLVPVRLPASAPVRVTSDINSRVTGNGPASRAEEISRSRNPAAAVAAIWLAGVALALGRTVYDRLRLRRIVAQSRTASPRLLEAFARARVGAQLPRLDVRVSDALDGPAIGGVFRPVILIPAWMDTGADDHQLDWALRHELRHATAHDTTAIALRELSLIAFWFHPLIWLAARRWESATELACDRDVVTSDAEAVDYADALYRTLLNVRLQPRLQLASGLFATRSKIGTRIAALVERPLAPKVGRPALALAAAIAVVVISLGADLSASDHKHHRGDYIEVVDGDTVAIRYEGEMDLGARVERLIGFIEMRETRDGVTRELRLDGDKDGIRRRYRIDGREAPPDDSFERVVTAQLRKLMRPR